MSEQSLNKCLLAASTWFLKSLELKVCRSPDGVWTLIACCSVSFCLASVVLVLSSAAQQSHFRDVFMKSKEDILSDFVGNPKK